MAEFTINLQTTGSAQIEAALKKIALLTQQSSRGSLELAKALNISAAKATDLAKSLGKTPSEVAQIVARSKELQKAGFSSAEGFAILNKELGVTQKQFSTLSQESAVFAKSASEVNEQMQSVGIAAGAVAAAVGGVFAKGTQDFLAFDNALRQSRVILGESEEGVAGLRAEVERLGIVTSKTPKEVAELTIQLARAGFTAQEQTEALEGIARASEAAGDSLSVVGEVIGQTIRVFGLQASESQDVADRLVATANNTNTSVAELGEALSYTGSQAKQANQPLDDTLISLGLLADAGIKGSSGGTAYAEALRRISLASAGANTEFADLVRGSKKATEAFAVLETDVRDANGQLKPMTEILPVLANRFDQLETQADKEVLANALFGVQGGKAFLTLLGNVGGRLDLVSEKVKNSGGLAVEAGEQMLTGLGGALDLLGGSVDTATGKFGAFVAEGLEPLTRLALTVINQFLGLPPSFQNVIIATTGLVGAITGLIAVMTALELLQLRSKLALIGESVGLAANTVAKLANAAATEALTVAQLKNVAAVGVSSAAWKGFTATLVSFRAAAMAALPALALLAAGLALGDVLKTTGEILELRKEIDALGKGSAAVFDSALKVAEGLKNVNNEINDARAKGLLISDALLEKQRQYVALGKQTVADLNAEIAARQEVIDIIESGKGATDVPGLAEMTADAQQSFVNALKAQQAELGIGIRLIEGQAKASEESATAAAAVADETGKVTENLEDATSAADKLSAALSAIDLDVTEAQTAAYAELGDNKEALEARLTSIESDALDKRLVQQTKYLDSLASATFETEAERATAVAETEQEIANIRLEQAKRASELSQEQAERVAEFEEEKRKKAEETAAEQQRLAEETAAKQAELLKQTQELEDANREAATQKELRDIELTQAAYQAATDAKVAGANAVLESIDDQTVALQQQNAVLDLQLERLKIQEDRTKAGSDAFLVQLEEARGLIERLNSGEASITEQKLIQQQLDHLGLSAKTTELELLDAQHKGMEEVRKTENFFLEQRQQLEAEQLQNQQALEQLALKRAVTEAEINKTKAQQLVIDQQILQLQNQVALVRAQSALDVAKSRGASLAELAALQTEVAAQKQILELGQQGVETSQQTVDLAKEQVLDAQNAVTEYQKIVELQTENLELSQSFARGQKQSADETEKLAAALERAALAGDRVRASAVVGTPSAATGGSGSTSVTRGSGSTSATGATAQADTPSNSRVLAGKTLERKVLERKVLSRTTRTSGGTTVVPASEPRSTTSTLRMSFVVPTNTLRSAGERLSDSVDSLTDNLDRLDESFENVTSITQRRHGGTVTPGSLYQVNEAGLEAFKPLGGKPQLLNQPANSLFSPLVPGRILTAPQVNQMLPNLNNASSGGLVGLGRLESEIRGLRSDIASRPVQVDMGASTFINEPSPLATQLQIARGRLKAARGLL